MIENSQSPGYLKHEAEMEKTFVASLNQATGSNTRDLSAGQLPHDSMSPNQPLANPEAPNSSPQDIKSDENPVLWAPDAKKSDFQRS